MCMYVWVGGGGGSLCGGGDRGWVFGGWRVGACTCVVNLSIVSDPLLNQLKILSPVCG